MKNNETLSGTESMELISKMILTVRNDIQDNSFHYLLWGWLVFAASLGHYFLLQAGFQQPFLTWVILMPAGGIASMVYGRRQDKQQQVKTFVDDFMKYVLIAFLVPLFIVLGFMGKLGLSTYPMVMMIYGIWLFISGGAIRFKPLIAGGIINWICGIIAFFLPFEMQLLVLSLAVLLGYIIPGHLLRRKHINKN